jgi:hypothetical protein
VAVAPDIPTLFAYESEVLPGWVQVLSDEGLNAFIEFSDQNKSTPYVDVYLDNIVPTGHQYNHSNGLYYDAWLGFIIHRVYTQRGKNSDQQAPYLKAIREAALNFVFYLDEEHLPYHNVLMMKESPRHSGLRQGIDKALNLDWSELPLDIQFQIRHDSWPS